MCCRWWRKGGWYIWRSWDGIAADSLIPDDVKSRISGLVTRSTTRKTVANITLAMTASPQNKMEAQWDSTDFGALGFLLQAGGLDNAAQLVKQGSATTMVRVEKLR